jgi:hypothetical protein
MSSLFNRIFFHNEYVYLFISVALNKPIFFKDVFDEPILFSSSQGDFDVSFGYPGPEIESYRVLFAAQRIGGIGLGSPN